MTNHPAAAAPFVSGGAGRRPPRAHQRTRGLAQRSRRARTRGVAQRSKRTRGLADAHQVAFGRRRGGRALAHRRRDHLDLARVLGVVAGGEEPGRAGLHG